MTSLKPGSFPERLEHSTAEALNLPGTWLSLGEVFRLLAAPQQLMTLEQLGSSLSCTSHFLSGVVMADSVRMPCSKVTEQLDLVVPGRDFNRDGKYTVSVPRVCLKRKLRRTDSSESAALP